LFTPKYLADLISYERGLCSTHGEEKEYEILKDGDYVEYKGIDRRIILKWIKIFCDVIKSNLVDKHRCFGAIFCLELHEVLEL
jgi:hypothetical protein